MVRLVDGDGKVLRELVDGTLVEKPERFYEAQLAAAIIVALGTLFKTMTWGSSRAPMQCSA